MRSPLKKSLSLFALLGLVGAACTVTVPDELLSAGGGGDDPSIVTIVDGDPNIVTVPSDGGGGDGGAGDPTSTTISTLDPRVNDALQSFGPWTARQLPPFTDDRAVATDTFETPDRIVVTCAPALESRTFRPGTFDDFAAFPFSGDKLPGLIVEGALIEDGDLRVLPLPRAPLPLVVNLASEAPTIVVDDPSPASLQQAVAQLMRTADERLSGLSVVPANIRFVQKEVSSYEEAVLSMGVSLRYDSPALQAKFKSEFEQRRGVEKHSVMVRLLQPMFTISTDRSQIFNPGSFFASSTSMTQVDELVGQNRMGTDNPPVMIDAVTYGRVVYVTVTSSKVTSSEELKVAVSGAYNGFSGSGDLKTRNESIMKDAEIRVEAYGGNDDIALAALRSGKIQDFMESVDTSTAAPLSMVLRTLDGTKLAVTDEATITDIGCTRQDRPNVVGLQLQVGNASTVTVKVNGSTVGTYTANTSSFVDLSASLFNEGPSRVELVYQPPTCIGGSMTASFKVNGATSQKGGTQQVWRIAGHAGEWACTETGTWTVNKSNGTVELTSGPPALRLT